MTETSPALAMRGIFKDFGGGLALDDVSFTVNRGTLHALLGENGAGKTTLMRIAFGLLRADAGTLVLDGVPRDWRSSADAIAAGLGMVHQHFMLVPALTVAENVALGSRGFFSGFTARDAAARIRRIDDTAGLAIDPAARVSDLTVAAQQRLELVRALTREARFLILDEPTAVLSPRESRELYAWLRRFVDAAGTVVLITHKVREALAVADAVTVLRRGRTVLQSPVCDVAEETVVAALLGESPVESREPSRATARAPGEAVLVLDSVSVLDAFGTGRLRNASMTVHRGEIVGVAGVDGAGQWELLRVLAGRIVPVTGTVRLPDHIGFVPEDRLRDAIISSMSLTENMALPRAGALRGIVPWPTFAERAHAVARRHDVRPPDAPTLGALSGGNQQKFVLGRELDGAPAALVAENPTRGLDIRAASDVLSRLRDARDAGCALVVYSSDLDEVISIADRLFVCFDGRVREMPINAELAGRAMVGLP